MLNLLRADITKENTTKTFSDLMMESINTMDIRDAFMEDDVDENDPELEKLIDGIPESDDVSEDDLDELTESLIPELDEVM